MAEFNLGSDCSGQNNNEGLKILFFLVSLMNMSFTIAKVSLGVLTKSNLVLCSYSYEGITLSGNMIGKDVG